MHRKTSSAKWRPFSPGEDEMEFYIDSHVKSLLESLNESHLIYKPWYFYIFHWSILILDEVIVYF